MNTNLQAASDAIQQAQVDIDGQSAAIQTLNQSLLSANLQIQALQTQLSTTQALLDSADAQLADPILQSFTQIGSLEIATGWKLAKGTVGNSGAAGSPGAGTFDPTGLVSIYPSGPYYNSYWYLPLAQTPNANVRFFHNHVEYFFPTPTDFANCQAVENEIKWYDGTKVWDMAWQGLPNKTWRYFHFTGTPGTGGWVDSGIPCKLTPGAWGAMDAFFTVDPLTGTKTHLGLLVDGVYHPVGYQEQAVPKSDAPWFLTSVQLDSNSRGMSYSVQVRNRVSWL